MRMITTMNTMPHTCITDKKEKQFMEDKEVAKVIRSKVDELNKLLGMMAGREVSVSIGAESSYLNQDVHNSIRIQRIKVYSFSKTEKF